MDKKRKISFLTAVITVALLSLTGCGGGSGSASTQTSAAATTTTTTPTLSAADKMLQAAGVSQYVWAPMELIHADYAFSNGDLGSGVPIVFADQSDLAKTTATALINQPFYSNIDRFFNNQGDTAELTHDSTVAGLSAGNNEGVAPKAVIYNGSTYYLDVNDGSGTSDVSAGQANNGSAGIGGVINMSYGGGGLSPLVQVMQSSSSVLATLASNDELLVEASGDNPVPLCGGQDSLYQVGPVVGGISCTDLNGDQALNSAAPAFLDPRTKGNYLIVGETSVKTPGTPTPQGTFPGSNAEVEATFIVAPGYGLVFGNGTSYAAPLVSGAIADLRAAYPTLTAQQVRKIILDSARTNFSTEYTKNTCGPNGTTNCGKYYFGVGMLDIEAALKLAANAVAGTATP